MNLIIVRLLEFDKIVTELTSLDTKDYVEQLLTIFWIMASCFTKVVPN